MCQHLYFRPGSIGSGSAGTSLGQTSVLGQGRGASLDDPHPPLSAEGNPPGGPVGQREKRYLGGEVELSDHKKGAAHPLMNSPKESNLSPCQRR